MRQGKRACRAAAPREAIHGGTARIAEARHLRDLVEGLTGRVVARPRKALDPLSLEPEDVRVAARDHERGERLRHRKRGATRAIQERRERVPLDVVHGNEGHREPEREALSLREADEQGAAETAMGLLLRRHSGGARPARAVEKRDGGLVAGRLETEDERLVRLHRERSRANATACGGEEIPRSVTIASTKAPGVTSKAG